MEENISRAPARQVRVYHSSKAGKGRDPGGRVPENHIQQRANAKRLARIFAVGS